jgi:uncharacterized protein with PQ loop repeat
MSQYAEEALIKSKKRQKRDHLQSFMLVVAIIEPSTTLPQIYEVWAKHQIIGVSILTWIFFAVVALIWFLYGLKIKNTPVQVASFLWFISEVLVILGIIFN